MIRVIKQIGKLTYRARCSYCGLSTVVRKVTLETGGHGYRCAVCKAAHTQSGQWA